MERCVEHRICGEIALTAAAGVSSAKRCDGWEAGFASQATRSYEQISTLFTLQSYKLAVRMC